MKTRLFMETTKVPASQSVHAVHRSKSQHQSATLRFADGKPDENASSAKAAMK
jgi:hypothetical protein